MKCLIHFIMRRLFAFILIAFLFHAPAFAQMPVSEKKSEWHGSTRLDFQINGRNCILVQPTTPAPGNPWIWRAEFFGHQPQADVALLGKGFHVAYITVPNLYGAPVALDEMDVFYAFLVKEKKLSTKPVLEGFSRGGLYALNWAIRHPSQVSALYLDAPVCDFKSWPAGKGKGKYAKREWEQLRGVYGFKTEAEALAYTKNPVDNLAPLARQKVPILSVVGMADRVVPVAENTDVLEKRYKELGGPITVIRKAGIDHHPHSLKDPTPIVDFVVKAVAERK